MPRKVKIAPGKFNVVLPDGGAYGEGAEVVLTDEQFARLDADVIGVDVLDLGSGGMDYKAVIGDVAVERFIGSTETWEAEGVEILTEITVSPGATAGFLILVDGNTTIDPDVAETLAGWAEVVHIRDAAGAVVAEPEVWTLGEWSYATVAGNGPYQQWVETDVDSPAVGKWQSLTVGTLFTIGVTFIAGGTYRVVLRFYAAS